jgi:hypothetical protein
MVNKISNSLSSKVISLSDHKVGPFSPKEMAMESIKKKVMEANNQHRKKSISDKFGIDM